MEQSHQPGKGARITGWVLSGIVILFCLFDSFGKFAKPEAVIEGTRQFGYPEHLITPIGIMLLVCTVLYSIPRTALLGAVLLTGYLGGAVASNVRVENPLFSHTLFSVYFAIIAWLGLYLRSGKLRRLVSNRD